MLSVLSHLFPPWKRNRPQVFFLFVAEEPKFDLTQLPPLTHKGGLDAGTYTKDCFHSQGSVQQTPKMKSESDIKSS